LRTHPAFVKLVLEMKNNEQNINFHSIAAELIGEQLKTDTDRGLKAAEAEERLKKNGYNSIENDESTAGIILFLRQFKSPVTLLLVVASAFSFYFREWLDGYAIIIVVLINAGIGFFMEFQAERSMSELKKLSAVHAKVLREKKLIEIPSENIVSGDIVYVEAGDLVPADGRIFRLAQLFSDESTLTGESFPVEKQTEKLDPETTLVEKTNMLFKGTFVSKGNGWMAVTGTGASTELGKIARLIMTAENTATPLEKKLNQLAGKLVWITVALAVIFFIAGLIYAKPFVEIISTAIALAVAAIPEGLPIVATIALAQGMMRMADRNVIIKKLSAVESLGSTTVICTDKTGTLTKNKIEVENIYPVSPVINEKMLHAMILCNTAEVYLVDDKFRETGDPMETGLLKYVINKNFEISEVRRKYPKLKEIPFSSETKLMFTLHKSGNSYVSYAKGATEQLLTCCSYVADESGKKELSEEIKNNWLTETGRLASNGWRVIALAYKETIQDDQKPFENLIFGGLVAMTDPPREEVYAALNECKTAGIHVIMLTGDHPATALKTATDLGIASPENTEVITGRDMKDFELLTQQEKQALSASHVFARVSPKNKLDLVKILQEKGEIVAMTGDGVNDAPALKESDIGIAMGQGGTQVAREVSDMILKDNSFSSIVIAVKQGRIIFENIRKFVVFLLSCNLSELSVIAITNMFNLHYVLFPLQILFINLITDVLPALALGVTPGNDDIMKRPPLPVSSPVIARKQWKATFIYSLIIASSSLSSVYIFQLITYAPVPEHTEQCNNILFFTLIFSQLLHAFNMDTGKTNFSKSGVIRNKYLWFAIIVCVLIIAVVYQFNVLKKALDIVSLTQEHWVIIAGCSFASFLIVFLLKRLRWVEH